MRYVVVAVWILAVALALAATTLPDGRVREAPAAAVIALNFTETDTLYVPAGFSVLSIDAIGGNIGVRLLNGPHYGLPDSIPVEAGKQFNVNLSTRPGGMMSYGLAVYLGEGASATGVAW